MTQARLQISLRGIVIVVFVASLVFGYFAVYRGTREAGLTFIVAGAAIAFLFSTLTRYPWLGIPVALATQLAVLRFYGLESELPFEVIAPLLIAIQTPILAFAAVMGWAFRRSMPRQAD